MEDAWRSFTDRIAALGAFVGDDADGMRHLAGQVAHWLEWALGSGDGERPRLIRQNEPFGQWGGPNADNVYKYARLDPATTYRLHGSMGCCEEMLLAVRVDNLHMPERGTKGELRVRDLGIVEGDDVDVTLGPPGSGADLELDPAVRMLAIREYYLDWRPLEPASLVLDRVSGGRPAAPRPLAEALDEAAAQVERSLVFWDEYMARDEAEGATNVLAAPRREAVGLKGLTYAFAYYDLGVDDALVVDTEPPDADYWSFQLYTLRWFEAHDFEHRITSLNHRQVVANADGTVTVVVSRRDPGAANWLDTSTAAQGLLTFRTAWARGGAEPTSRVVPVDELPPSIPRVDADGRAAQLAARHAHLARRWRA